MIPPCLGRVPKGQFTPDSRTGANWSGCALSLSHSYRFAMGSWGPSFSIKKKASAIENGIRRQRENSAKIETER